MVEVLNGYYFLFLGIFLLITFLLTAFLKNKSDKVKYYTVLGIVLSSFLLHFLKLAFEPYRSDFPNSIRKVTFENICAVSTLLFPFFYISKSEKLKDYMVVIGMISGLGAFMFPTEAFGKNVVTFDVLRFYYCHYCLFISGFLMAHFHLHRLSYKRILFIPMLFVGVLCLILLNEVILMAFGLVSSEGYTDSLEALLDPNYRNSSLIFGIPDSFSSLSFLFNWLTIKAFTINPFTNEPMYWPIVWEILPVTVYCILLGLLNCFIFAREEMVADYNKLKIKVKEYRKAR